MNIFENHPIGYRECLVISIINEDVDTLGGECRRHEPYRDSITIYLDNPQNNIKKYSKRLVFEYFTGLSNRGLEARRCATVCVKTHTLDVSPYSLRSSVSTSPRARPRVANIRVLTINGAENHKYFLIEYPLKELSGIGL